MKNIALIGYGGMGKNHINNILNMTDILNLQAIYDIDPAKVDSAIAAGLPGKYKLDDILNDKEIDIVIIAVPNDFHKELSIACLKSGKNVICEKPVMMSADQLIEVIQTAKLYGKLFTVDQNRRWDKDFRMIKKVYENKVLGMPYFIESRVQGSRGVPQDWRKGKKQGGGMLFDWGVHLIDQIMWMIDSPVVEVYTHMVHAFEEADDNFKLLLKFANGISAQIEVDTYCFYNLPRWHMQCREGTAVIHNWACEGHMYKEKPDDGTYVSVPVQTGSGPSRTMAPRGPETIEVLDFDTNVDTDFRRGYYVNVIGAIDGTAELIVKPEQALRVMKVIDAVFDSEKYGMSIKCNI